MSNLTINALERLKEQLFDVRAAIHCSNVNEMYAAAVFMTRIRALEEPSYEDIKLSFDENYPDKIIIYTDIYASGWRFLEYDVTNKVSGSRIYKFSDVEHLILIGLEKGSYKWS